MRNLICINTGEAGSMIREQPTSVTYRCARFADVSVTTIMDISVREILVSCLERRND